MASGLTTVASRLRNVTDKILQDGKEGFLVNRNDISGFASAILKASENPGLRKEIANASRLKIASTFSMEIHGQNYKNVLESAMADESYDYKVIEPLNRNSVFLMPETLKPHVLSRILPDWLKRILKKIV